MSHKPAKPHKQRVVRVVCREFHSDECIFPNGEVCPFAEPFDVELPRGVWIIDLGECQHRSVTTVCVKFQR